MENCKRFKVIDCSIYTHKLPKNINKKDYFEYVLNDFLIKTKEGQKPSIEDYFEYVLFAFLVETEDGQRLNQDDFFLHLRNKYFDIVKTKINAEIQAILEKAEASDAQNEFNN
jgi:hypothetical protein